MAISIREHATRLSNYLQDSLASIERTNSQPVPADFMKMIHGTLTFILKVQYTPTSTRYATPFESPRLKSRSLAGNTAHALNNFKNELKNTTETIRQTAAIIQENTNTGEEARPRTGSIQYNRTLGRRHCPGSK
jgi:hypothetical protein